MTLKARFSDIEGFVHVPCRTGFEQQFEELNLKCDIVLGLVTLRSPI